MTVDVVAQNIVKTLNELPDTKKIEPTYRWQLIKDDPDDDKYIDCAVAANADYIISNDKHFAILDTIDFPQLTRLKLSQVKKDIF